MTANPAFYATFQVTPREVEQQLLSDLCGGNWNSPDLRSFLEEVLSKGSSFRDFVLAKTFPQIGRKVWVLNGRRLDHGGAQSSRILLAMEELKQQEGAINDPNRTLTSP